MNCASEKKQWVVYDEKNRIFLELDHTEFKNLLLDRPHILSGKNIYNKEKEKMVWVDVIVNR